MWPWSKEAVGAFFAAASKGKGRFHVREGMDAALLEDLPGLAFALARFWVETLTSEGRPPIIFKVTQEGKEVILHADRDFLLRVCCLEVPPEGLTIETPPEGGLVAP